MNNITSNLINSDKKKILEELITNQLSDVKIDRKLYYKDFRRIIKYIDSSIFGDKCCMWNGYVTNETNSKRGTYVNFFFRNKKVALHRLLYENFVGDLSDEYYLKFICEDENCNGKCCNINHMKKYKYNNNNNDDEQILHKSEKKPKKKNMRKVQSLNENLELRFD